MKYIPYGRQSIDSSDIKAVLSVLKSDFLTQGPRLEEFEKAICRYTGARYCLALSSATAALHIGILALELEKGSEGITSPITFVASANCLLYANLKPKFADIDSTTYNINPDEIKKKITNKTKVLVPVHFRGLACDMIKIHQIAKKNKLFVIEDASHAIGSRYEDGSVVGSCKYSDLTVFSFHPVKTITCGEGGAVTTNNKRLYQKLLLLRTHGITKDPKQMSQSPGPWYYEMQRLGFNYRLSELHATLGLSQFKKLNRICARRRKIINDYNHAFADLSAVTTAPEDDKSCYHLYVLKIDFKRIKKSRKQVMQELKEMSIGTQVHYIPVHLQPYYQKLGYRHGDFSQAEKYYKEALSLPLYHTMTDRDISRVIVAVKRVINEKA